MERPFLSVFAGLMPFSPAANINYFADGSNWPSKRASICVKSFSGPKDFAASEDTNAVLTLSSSKCEFLVLECPFLQKFQLLCLNLCTAWSQSCLLNTIHPWLMPWPLDFYPYPEYPPWLHILVPVYVTCSFLPVFPCLYSVLNLRWPYFPDHLSWN